MTQRKSFPLLGTLLLTLVALFCQAGARPASAATPLVRDDAHLFDAATLDQANAIVKEIHAKFGKDLTIQTFATIPESLKPGFAAENKEAFYEHWLRREARAAETNGVFVLIVKDPGRLQIGVGSQTSPKAFTFADRDEMRDLMLKDFREKKFNDGLLAGTRFVLNRMEKNGAEHVKTPEPELKIPTPAPAPTQPAPVTPTTAPATEPIPAPTPASAPTTRQAVEIPATKSISPESGVKPAPRDGVELNK